MEVGLYHHPQLADVWRVVSEGFRQFDGPSLLIVCIVFGLSLQFLAVPKHSQIFQSHRPSVISASLPKRRDRWFPNYTSPPDRKAEGIAICNYSLRSQANREHIAKFLSSTQKMI